MKKKFGNKMQRVEKTKECKKKKKSVLADISVILADISAKTDFFFFGATTCDETRKPNKCLEITLCLVEGHDTKFSPRNMQ